MHAGARRVLSHLARGVLRTGEARHELLLVLGSAQSRSKRLHHSGLFGRVRRVRIRRGCAADLFALGPHNRGMRIIGDEGMLVVEDCWDFGTRVRISRRTRLGVRAEKHPLFARLTGLGPRALPLVRKPSFRWKVPGANRIDFARGVAETAAAILESGLAG